MNEIDLQNFNQFMMNKAREVAKTSNCLRKKVGAVITFDPTILSFNYKEFSEIDYNDAIISFGTNKCLDRDESCEAIGCLIIDNHCERTRHAELSAMDANRHFSYNDKWLYITTAPCIKCFQEIIVKNIKTVWCGDTSYWNIHEGYREYVLGLAKKYNVKIEII